MKHIRILIAVPALACGVALAGASQASAKYDPESGRAGQAVVVVHDPGQSIQVDDNVAEALQAGASALGGAGIALAALWAYRRRHPVGIQ
jgi:hypothetical protein